MVFNKKIMCLILQYIYKLFFISKAISEGWTVSCIDNRIVNRINNQKFIFTNSHALKLNEI